jgi:hypothetical protein
VSNDFVPPGGPAPAGSPAYEPPAQPLQAAQQHAAAAPYGSAQPAVPTSRPKSIDAAFWLYVAAAVLGVIALIVSFTQLDAARDAALRQLEQQGQGDVLPREAVEGAMWVGAAIGVVFSLLFAAAYVVFAMLMRRGYGWARFVLGAFAVLALLGVAGAFGLGALQFLCLAVATVLVFLPASNAYFRSTAQGRQTRAV